MARQRSVFVSGVESKRPPKVSATVSGLVTHCLCLSVFAGNGTWHDQSLGRGQRQITPSQVLLPLLLPSSQLLHGVCRVIVGQAGQ
jgi:hypothetical protein